MTGKEQYRLTSRGNALERLRPPCDVKIHLLRHGEEPLAPLDPGFVPDLLPARLTSIRMREDGATIRIHCEGSEDLTGAWLYADSSLWKEAGSVYVYEILGCTILDGQGQERGIVRDYFETGSTGVLNVETKDKPVFIPSIDEFVDYSRIGEKVLIVGSFDDFVP